MEASEEGSVQKRKMGEKRTNVMSSSRKQCKTVQENSKCTVAEDIRVLPVEEEG